MSSQAAYFLFFALFLSLYGHVASSLIRRAQRIPLLYFDRFRPHQSQAWEAYLEAPTYLSGKHWQLQFSVGLMLLLVLGGGRAVDLATAQSASRDDGCRGMAVCI